MEEMIQSLIGWFFVIFAGATLLFSLVLFAVMIWDLIRELF